MDNNVKGKVVVVTGASSGIGEAIVYKLANRGARVAMAARRVDKLRAMQDSLSKDDIPALALKCDVTDRIEVDHMITAVEEQFGHIDVLVNNAGVMNYVNMVDGGIDIWNTMIDVNCKGTLHCLAAVLPRMKSRGQGHIINMSSDGGRAGFCGLAVYCGTKFFIEGMSTSLRKELIGTGIRVTSIQPGNVESNLLVDNYQNKKAFEKWSGPEGASLKANDVAEGVLYALNTPAYVGVNEILLEHVNAPI